MESGYFFPVVAALTAREVLAEAEPLTDILAQGDCQHFGKDTPERPDIRSFTERTAQYFWSTVLACQWPRALVDRGVFDGADTKVGEHDVRYFVASLYNDFMPSRYESIDRLYCVMCASDIASIPAISTAVTRCMKFSSMLRSLVPRVFEPQRRISVIGRWMVQNERHWSVLSFPFRLLPTPLGAGLIQLGSVVFTMSACTSAKVARPNTADDAFALVERGNCGTLGGGASEGVVSRSSR